MKMLVKLYLASSLIVAGCFLFFSIPWGLLPFSDAVDVMVVGAAITSVAGMIVSYNVRRERFEFGWFLANRGGFWILTIAILGLAVLLCGTLLFLSPDLFVPVFEQGSLPIGMIIVSMFWMALIFMFGFLSFSTLENAIPAIRKSNYGEMLAALLAGSFCVFLTGVFFSLYLDVIDDNVVRIDENTRRYTALGSASFLGIVGIGCGVWRDRAEPQEDH